MILPYTYGPKAWDIVGYTYAADQYCRGCMWQIAVEWADLPAGLRDEMKSMGTEDALDAAAKFWGIDRQGEDTFDSGDFPKVIFESQICQENCRDDFCDHEANGCGHDYCGTLNCGRLCEQ